MEKATIESREVTDSLQHLAVSNRRSETPPPHAHLEQGKGLHSSPSICKVDLSPSHKENASPTPLAQKQPRPYDLTPVTRNTGTTYVDEKRLVSPDDSLTHSGLSLPSGANFESSSRPPFKRRSAPLICPIKFGDRSMSLTGLNELQADEFNLDDDDDDDRGGQLVGEAISFPSRQHFFSFNSRHHYEQQMPGLANDPYQPSRQDLADVGCLPSEELSGIFHQRDLNPIPLGERQFSIPSIRMANQLNGSTTTYDDEDEDDLSKDDASWSSRGSSLYLPDDNENYVSSQQQQVLKFTPTTSKPLVILEDLPFPEISVPLDAGTIGAVYHHQLGSGSANRKRKESHEKAFEWLRTVETTGDDSIREAASSKFLTRGDIARTTIASRSAPTRHCKGDDDFQETVFARLKQRGGVKGITRQISLPPEMLQPSGRSLFGELD